MRTIKSRCICSDSDHDLTIHYCDDDDEFYLEFQPWKYPNGVYNMSCAKHEPVWFYTLRVKFKEIGQRVIGAFRCLFGMPVWYISNQTMDRTHAKVLVDFIDDCLKKFDSKEWKKQTVLGDSTEFHAYEGKDGSYWLKFIKQEENREWTISDVRISKNAFEELDKDSVSLHRPGKTEKC